MRQAGLYLTFVFLLTGLAGLHAAPGDAPAQPADTELHRADERERADEIIRKTLRRSGTSQVRTTLIEEIAAKKQEGFLSDLVAVLSDDDEEVRKAAASALTVFPTEKTSALLIPTCRDKDAPVHARELACGLLVKSGRVDVVGPLIDALDEPTLLSTALAGLKQITFQDFKTPGEWRTWWEANRNSTQVQWAAARTGELLQRIIELEKQLDAARKRCIELDARVADAAVRVLEDRVNKQDPAPLVTALGDPYPRVRKYAAAELGKLKAAEAAKKLSEMVAAEPDAEVRLECVRALGQIASEGTVAVLARLLDDPNEEIAAAAARGLGRLKDATVVNRLLLSLLNRSSVLRGSAAEALGQIGSEAAVVPLEELLGADPESTVRERAARALGEIGDKRAVPALEKALKDDSPAVRIYAIEALGTLKATEVAPKLAAVLKDDKTPSVREAAAVTLGKVGGRESLDVLIDVLGHPEEKLAQLTPSSIVAICQRDETLFEPTGDALLKAGYPAHAATLYDLLAQKLADRKEDKRLISVRGKLVDVYLTLKQWTKAEPLLEQLTRTLPDDVGLAERYARTLGELRKHVEAFGVYRALAARAGSGAYWSERLALLDEMLDEGKTADVLRLSDESLKEKAGLTEEVRGRLEGVRGKAAEAAETERRARTEETRRLIREAASDGETRAAAREKLKAHPDEAYPQLVEALDWADEKVRGAAAELLREMSKQNFGYRPEATLEENAEAIRKWKAWLKARKPE